MTRTLRDICVGNAKLQHDNRNEFLRIFGVSLAHFHDNLYGFDLLKFEQEFIPDDVAIYDAVLAQFGTEGVEIIKVLLKIER